MLADLGPALPDKPEVLHPVQTHAENLSRAIELGSEVVPSKPPALEAALGLGSHARESIKHQLVDQVGELARTAAAGNTVICVKPHAGDEVNNVERSLWLVRQAGSRHFRCTHDFGQLWLAGHELVP